MTLASRPAVSTFDPTAPGARSRVLDWLSARNTLDDDKHVIDESLPLAVLLPGRRTSMRFLGWIRPAWNATRAHRTTARQIGLFVCDEAAILNRRLARALVVRGILVVLACVVGWSFGTGAVTMVLLAATTWTTTGWTTPWALFAAAAATAGQAWREPPWLGLLLATDMAALVTRRVLALVETGFSLRSPLGSPTRFLGRGILVRALWDRPTASALLALDKATHDDRVRARIFLEDCAATAPGALRPVLRQCEALVESAALDFQTAIISSHEAAGLAESAPAAVRGWCALHFGDVLLAAGDAVAAESKWDEAVSLFGESKAGRFWRLQAELRLIQVLTSELADSERVLRGLRLLQRLRVLAVRSIDAGLLENTEYFLLRLMNDAGNGAGVYAHMIEQRWHDRRKVMIGTTIGQHAAKSLLKASLMVDVAESPQRYPSAVPVGRAQRYNEAAELVDNALQHLSRTRQPLLDATAYAAMARVQLGLGHRDAALANTLECLTVIQRVRYLLPTTSWRARWVRTHAQVYTMALDLAAGDPGLAGELLELVRAQAVPVERDEAGSWVRAALNAVVASISLPPDMPPPPPTTEPDDAGSGAVGTTGDATASAVADPLIAHQAILVQHASWIGGDEASAVDVDDELDLMFPGAWYWSLARVGEWVYHAVRSPRGDWWAQRQPYDDAAGHLDDLLWRLPVDLAGESDHRYQARLAGTAFVHEHPERSEPGGPTAGEVWDRILDGLGAALIPTPLRDALAADDRIASVVVAPTGTLALIPFAALSVTPGKPLIDLACVTHLPAVALAAHRRRTVSESGVRSIAGKRSRVIAVLAPHSEPPFPEETDFDDDDLDLPFAFGSVPAGSDAHRGGMTKNQFAALMNSPDTPDAVLYLAGHVEGSANEDPAGTGFKFYDGRLTLRDLYEVDSAMRPIYNVPRRVVLSGCTSLGLYADTATRQERSFAAEPEWLGLAAAMVFGGADHVYCSLFPVLESFHTMRVDLALVEAMRHEIDPAQALRAVQRAEIQRWRTGRGAQPIVFMAYAYVGLGATTAARST